MRSSTLHLFAAAVLAIPTLTLAQSANPNQNDPFYARRRKRRRASNHLPCGFTAAAVVRWASKPRWPTCLCAGAPKPPEPQEVPEGLPRVDA